MLVRIRGGNKVEKGFIKWVKIWGENKFIYKLFIKFVCVKIFGKVKK